VRLTPSSAGAVARWVWVAMDPESKLLRAIDVGNRTLAMAQRVVHQVAQVLLPAAPRLSEPMGSSKTLSEPRCSPTTAWIQRHGDKTKGPAPKPRWNAPAPRAL